MYIVLIINIVLFLVYNLYIIHKYHIPSSLSETAYLLDKQYWLFTILCLLTSFSILPIWFEIGSSDWNFLKFLSIIGLIFTGVTPFFKKGLDQKIHYTASILTCVCFLTWLGLNGFWWTLGIGTGIFAILTAIDYKNVVYYGEVACWMGLLIQLLIQSLN